MVARGGGAAILFSGSWRIEFSRSFFRPGSGLKLKRLGVLISQGEQAGALKPRGLDLAEGVGGGDADVFFRVIQERLYSLNCL